MSLKPEFLKYFDEVSILECICSDVNQVRLLQIAQGVFGDRYSEFHAELSRRLKLTTKLQLMVALSLAESCPEDNKQDCKCPSATAPSTFLTMNCFDFRLFHSKAEAD